MVDSMDVIGSVRGNRSLIGTSQDRATIGIAVRVILDEHRSIIPARTRAKQPVSKLLFHPMLVISRKRASVSQRDMTVANDYRLEHDIPFRITSTF
jgi:ABC-type uncharacterized transport system auxiliary subunit